MAEQFVANKFGHELLVEFLPNCSAPAMGRNQLINSFIESGYDKLIFLDSDITFEIGALVKLAVQPVDFVGGAYRFKQAQEKYPVTFTNKEYLVEEIPGLIEVEILPAGFTCMSRKVFDDIRNAHPERAFILDEKKIFPYFTTLGTSTEEGAFSHDWQQTGGKIYLYPDLTITHWNFDPVPYAGNIGNWFKSQITEDQKNHYLQTKQQGEICV